jgi:MFS family permease
MVIPVIVFCWTILKKKTFCSALTYSLEGMLFGRFLVGIGMGLGPPVASLYITEVSPPSVRGTYGSFVQIATCLGILFSLLIGTPVKDIDRWSEACAALLQSLQVYCSQYLSN